MKKGNTEDNHSSSKETIDKQKYKRDAKWENMERILQSDMDKLLTQSSDDDEDVHSEKEVSSEDEFSNANMLRFMKEMESEMEQRKRRSKSSFIFNAFVGAVGFGIGIFLTRFINGGRWKPLKLCQTKSPPEFCHSCYGPFVGGDWLWCLQEDSETPTL